MVIIIDDWGVLEEYAGEKLGFYQLFIMIVLLKFECKLEGWVLKESLQTAMTSSTTKFWISAEEAAISR